jgi:hypothetical protein
MVGGMTKPDSCLRSLIGTVALLRCLAAETKGLLIEVTGLLIALAGLVAAVAAMTHHWL